MSFTVLFYEFHERLNNAKILGTQAIIIVKSFKMLVYMS